MVQLITRRVITRHVITRRVITRRVVTVTITITSSPTTLTTAGVFTIFNSPRGVTPFLLRPLCVLRVYWLIHTRSYGQPYLMVDVTLVVVRVLREISLYQSSLVQDL